MLIMNNPTIDMPLFSLKYNGVLFSECQKQQKTVITDENNYENIFLFPDGLKITQKVTAYPQHNAIHWVLYFENTGDSNSAIISELFDCDSKFPFNSTFKSNTAGYMPNNSGAFVWHTIGSNWVRDEYSSYSETISPNTERKYTSRGGRSAQGFAPYFEISERTQGIICAIGWTGQWNAIFNGSENEVRMRTCIENVAFKLYSGEKIRSSSVILLAYNDGRTNGHNAFKRLVRESFSLIGTEGRPSHGPLCISTWGALSSDKMVKRIQNIKKYNIDAECYWIDAGWYGYSSGECPNEFVGDWGIHTGSWIVNKNYHPDGFMDVKAALEKANLDFLLWFEPERVISNTDTPSAHPDWFFKRSQDCGTWLLNLGNEDAWNGTYNMLCDYIEKLNLACYRQDFNTDPLEYWRENDLPERSGINEIKHINGLYRLWDALLARFPHIYIDNCASGGRRNDIEMLSRSIPLWRSDYQCTFDADPETAQNHTTGISQWLPYSGTGVGVVIGDIYRTRSCYSPAMTVECWMYEYTEIEENQPLGIVRALFDEYKMVRNYMSLDFYPLSEVSNSDAIWCAWQFDDDSRSSGVVLAFRRKKCPSDTAVFMLGNIDKTAKYSFNESLITENGRIDGECKLYSGNELANGLRIDISDALSSKVYFYKKI